MNIHTLSCYEMESALLCGIKITMTHFVENAIDYNYNTSSHQDTLFQKKLGLSGAVYANRTNLCPRAVKPPCLHCMADCTALRPQQPHSSRLQRPIERHYVRIQTACNPQRVDYNSDHQAHVIQPYSLMRCPLQKKID